MRRVAERGPPMLTGSNTRDSMITASVDAPTSDAARP